MTNYAYLRVSTDKQDIENQRHSVLKYANDAGLSNIQFVSEIISSRKDDRKIYSLVEKLESGDNLIVFEASRLGRSSKQIQRMYFDISDKKASLHIINMKMIFNGLDGVPIDGLYFAFFAFAAQMERDLISDRTKSALAAKKAAGVKLGRPTGSKLDSRVDQIQEYLDLDLNMTAISKLMDVHYNTFFHWMKKNRDKLTFK